MRQYPKNWIFKKDNATPHAYEQYLRRKRVRVLPSLLFRQIYLLLNMSVTRWKKTLKVSANSAKVTNYEIGTTISSLIKIDSMPGQNYAGWSWSYTILAPKNPIILSDL